LLEIKFINQALQLLSYILASHSCTFCTFCSIKHQQYYFAIQTKERKKTKKGMISFQITSL